MGEKAPADHIIATIVAITGTYCLPLMIPFVHRIPRRALSRALLVPGMVTIGAMAIFMMREPFDPMHPKRFFAMYLENVGPSTICFFGGVVNDFSQPRSLAKSSTYILQLRMVHLDSNPLFTILPKGLDYPKHPCLSQLS